MVDELNDETERRMDEMENRTRALAARVEALTAERDTARASSDRWHGVAHRMEAQLSEAREREGRYREHLDGVLTAWKREAQAGDGILEEHVRLFNGACDFLRDTRAALSPCACGICDECDQRNRATSPSPASGVVGTKKIDHEFRPGDPASGWERQCSVVIAVREAGQWVGCHCGYPPEAHLLAPAKDGAR